MNINISGTPEEIRQFLHLPERPLIQGAAPRAERASLAAAGAAKLPLSPATGPSEVTEQVLYAARSNLETLQKLQVILAVHDNIFGPENYDIDHMQQWIHPDVRWYQFGKLTTPTGIKGVRQHFLDFSATFKFIKIRTYLAVGQDDYLSSSYELVARHVGEFMGRKPTHKTVSVHGINIIRIDNDRVIEYHDSYDIPGIVPQLDMMSARPTPSRRRGARA